MKYEYILLSDTDPHQLVEQVQEAHKDGYDLYGELATCPWTDRSHDRLDNDYCMLFQWMQRNAKVNWEVSGD